MIPINVDCGEEIRKGQDEIIIANCQWINVACGGHAGSKSTMEHCIKLAIEHDVKIGAHPSFDDKDNFGRIPLDIEEKKLVESLRAQIISLQEIVDKYNKKLHHIKPHGALYNIACKNEKEAHSIIQAMIDLNDKNIKLCAPESALMTSLAKEAGIEVVFESFADRVYINDGSLQSRSIEGAWFSDCNKILNQWYCLNNGYVITHEGEKLELASHTICLHGEHDNLEEIFSELKKFQLKLNHER